MLTQLFIRHVAIIKQLELEFQGGLTCITGETGAGKSVAIDALNLCLGGRIHADVIHHAHEQAEISAHFDLTHLPKASDWLESHHLSPVKECWIRRVFHRHGRSKNYINGTPTPVHLIRELSQFLVQIYGQHNQQTFLKSDCQRQHLDEYIGHDTLLQQVAHSWHAYQSNRAQLAALTDKQQAMQAKRELLTYQVNELNALNLEAQEYTNLEKEHRIQAYTTELLASYHHSLQLLEQSEQGHIMGMLSHIENQLTHATRYDSSIQNIAELLQQARIHLEETSHELHTRIHTLDFDADTFTQMEKRLNDIHALAKKHNVAPEALHHYIAEKQQALQACDDDDDARKHLEAQLEVSYQAYQKQAALLSESRRQGAEKFAQAISEKLRLLEMPHIQINIKCNQNPASMQVHGIDQVQFLMSANQGHDLQPVAQIASGGELSRIALVSQLCLAIKQVVPTLIFDEADAGISGTTATRVGQMLRESAHTSQIIAITHLPQIAALGHHHWFAHKNQNGQPQHTAIHFTNLDTPKRLRELARLLAGSQITATTLANAQELLLGEQINLLH